MKIEDFILDYFRKRLEKTIALVVYDSPRRYEKIIGNLKGEDCEVINASESTILGREKAIDAWCKLVETETEPKHLLIYLPVRRPKTDEERRKDPYQVFAIGGGEFPRDDGDDYKSLCHKAAPALVARIDELFKTEEPDFETINSLIKGKANWPKLRTVLNVESALEILVAFLSPSEEQKRKLEADEAWIPEFITFSKATIDFTPKTKSQKWTKINEELWRYMLFSEFVLDLPSDLPEKLKTVPCASSNYRDFIFSVCEALRGTERHQLVYMEMADKIANELKLEEHFRDIEEFGEIATFAFEDDALLKRHARDVLSKKVATGEGLSEPQKHSLWLQHSAERQLLWTIFERALKVLNSVDDRMDKLKNVGKSITDLFVFYCDSMRHTERLHRNFEQAVIDACGDLGIVDELVRVVRNRYLELAEKLQASFVKGVEEDGWPVEGKIRNTEVFDRFVAPWILEKRATALFMVDALRYELGSELEAELAKEFTTELYAVCAQLPTITSVGMAALMPGADGNLEISIKDGNLLPSVKGSKVLSTTDRINYIKGYYGDRCHMVSLDELLMKKAKKWPDTVDLLVVKTTDIDTAGESNPSETYRVFPNILKKLLSAVKRLKKVYHFERVVVATDHGFILLDWQKAGDAVEKPYGDWLDVKERCLLGDGSPNAGTVIFDKEHVGIKGNFQSYAVPKTFAAFSKGETYFHEGLSLQECVLPVICVDLSKKTEKAEQTIELHLSYKGGTTDKITTRRPMIEIVMYKSLFGEEPLEFQLEAYSKGKVVGEVGTSDYVNPSTNLVRIHPGEAIKVLLKMNEDFHGVFEVRATDPMTGANHHALKLKTDYME